MQQDFYTTKLISLYGKDIAQITENRLLKMIERFRKQIRIPEHFEITEKDTILITYADQVQQEGQAPLKVLSSFCEQHLKNTISSVHLLPFYPWSSDDGFAVKDYRSVDTRLGSWDDISRLRSSFRLMFDGVINHVSAQGKWFQAFLRNEEPYRDFFITIEGDPDLSKVIRPRTSPLLHEFQTSVGPRRVWTTFSADQVDLEYHNPEVFLIIIEILLEYIARGASFLRLDAIAYLWKEIGTSCIHLPQTHIFVQLLRSILEDVAPHVRLITETNVPHQENLSYFGDGTNEAHLVYNFALPPLVFHTFLSGDARKLSDWADGLLTPSAQIFFFNFLASHDGIGLNPVSGILSQNEIDRLVQATLSHGGRISYSKNRDASQKPYELNISYFDALSDPLSIEPISFQVKRFLSAQAILLSLRGLPGIYFHSLFGSRNWDNGVLENGQNRRINREKLNLQSLEQDLQDPCNMRSLVFEGFKKMLKQHASSAAFHPAATQKILHVGKEVFALLRTSVNEKERMLCIHNVTSETQNVNKWSLSPYEVFWIANP